VEVVEAAEDLRCVVAGHVVVENAKLGEDAREGAAGAVLHGDAQGVLALEHATVADDVGVAELPEGVELGAEGRGGADAALGRDHLLDCQDLASDVVDCLVYTPAAEGPPDDHLHDGY
jgi:hypothetical protein